MIGQLMLALAILITLHELGHFLAARMFGIKVEKFYLFFDAWGVKLFKFKKGDTEYGIGWLPLGGYVKIAGMIDESLDKEQMNKEPEDWEFRSKPAWQRLIVMLGGVLVNLVLGVFIYSMSLFYYGDKYMPVSAINDNGGIYAMTLGQEVGFENGDKIISLNGREIKKLNELMGAEALLGDKTVVKIIRDGQEMEIVYPENFSDLITSRQNEGFVEPRLKFIVQEVVAESPADKAGLQIGDKIVAVNDRPIEFFDELQEALKENKGQDVSLQVVREDKTEILSATIDTNATIGFRPGITGLEELQATDFYSFGKSLSEGTKRSFGTISANAVGLWHIVTGRIKAQNALQGPIAIAGHFGKVWNWQKFWFLTGLLSLILAFMNLLPIPALDGGHVVFLLIEMIIGKPVNDKILHGAQVAGMIILIALMVFVFGNDIFRLFK
jgi:regulator of sigma E protease